MAFTPCKEAVPGLVRIAYFWSPLSAAAKANIDGMRAAAQSLGLRLQSLEIRVPTDLAAAFEAVRTEHAQALLTNPDPAVNAERIRILEFALTERIWNLALPAATPGIFVGIRVAAGIAIVVTVTSEIVTNPRGLGYGMIVAQQSLQADLVWATLVWIGIVGWLVNWGLARLERRWLRWYWMAWPA